MSEIDTIPVRCAGVISSVVNGEAVLVIPDKGKVKVLNQVGARIWMLVDGRRSAGEIAAQVCAEYLVDLTTAEADTLAFLKELSQREIIKLG